jgi:hypothetical protein
MTGVGQNTQPKVVAAEILRNSLRFQWVRDVFTAGK